MNQYHFRWNMIWLFSHPSHNIRWWFQSISNWSFLVIGTNTILVLHTRWKKNPIAKCFIVIGYFLCVFLFTSLSLFHLLLLQSYRFIGVFLLIASESIMNTTTVRYKYICTNAPKEMREIEIETYRGRDRDREGISKFVHLYTNKNAQMDEKDTVWHKITDTRNTVTK